jgi:tetratricopeptide (TPR) repeat protein
MGEYLEAAAILDTERRRLRIQPAHTARLGALLGWALALQGSFTEAIRHLEIAVAERRTAADPRGLAALLGRLQWAYLGRGDYPHALELAGEANAAFREAGDRLGEVRTRTSRGQILVAQGLPAQGLEILLQSAESLREMGDVHCEAEALWLAAVALTDLGRLDEARPLLESSLARVREVPDRDDEFRMSIDLARVHREQARPQLALEAARLAHGIAVELGCHDGAGHALAEISGALRDLGARGESLAAAREAVELLSRSGGLWRALWALALAEPPEDRARAVASLELCEARLAAVRDTLPSAADRQAFEEVRRRPLADLHRLLLATGEDRRARDLQDRWPVALG